MFHGVTQRPMEPDGPAAIAPRQVIEKLNQSQPARMATGVSSGTRRGTHGVAGLTRFCCGAAKPAHFLRIGLASLQTSSGIRATHGCAGVIGRNDQT
jgi:hypothetical protein